MSPTALNRVAGTERAVALPPQLPVTTPNGRRYRLSALLALDRSDPGSDLRDLIGRAVDVDVDAVLLVGTQTLPRSGGSLSLDIASSAAIETIPADLDRAEIDRLHRHFCPISVAFAAACDSDRDTSDDDPDELAAAVRQALGLAAQATVALEPASPETWWP